MRDKRIDYFSKNLKYVIKKNGFKVVDFPMRYLGCTYQSFNWRLHKGQFHTKDLYICLDMFNVTLDELLHEDLKRVETGVESVKVVEPKKVAIVKKPPPKEDLGSGFKMLEELID